MTRLLAVLLSVAMVAGLSLAGGSGGARVGQVPVFALCITAAVGIQWLAFVPAYLRRTERFFDITGSLTYLTVTAVALLLIPLTTARSWLLAALVAVWAIRLGSFLLTRILADGADRRFDEIKKSGSRFFLTWTLQGVWVSLTMGAALAAITSGRSVPLGVFAWVGLFLWIVGFGIEAAADRQKRQFRAKPENSGRFIASGLWAWSRHPNYFGEIVLWLGVAVVAFPALNGWQYVTLISPLFVTVLLTKMSGIPLLEKRADVKWGGDRDYEDYKASTPVLVPRRPR